METNPNVDRMFEIMRKESNRIKTFQTNPKWPKENIDTKKLAKAGFFYTFTDDIVCCAFCKGKVYSWECNDDPMEEHVKHFTTCPFIMGGDVGNEPLGEDPFPGPKRPRPYDVCGIYLDPPSEARPATPPISHINDASNVQSSVFPTNLNGICKICYTNSIELVFLPCAHSVSCTSCAQRLSTCPCCRVPIATRIRTYLV